VLIGKYLTKFSRILLSGLQDLQSLGAEVASFHLLSNITCLTTIWCHLSH